MAARSIGSATLRLGLVAIPVKLYTATSRKSVSFNQLHGADCGSRVRQQLVCPAHKPPKVLEHAELVRGFEYTRERYVLFTADELRALVQAGNPDDIAIAAVVPAKAIDHVLIAKTMFLGPDKGAARAYHLLASLLGPRVAVGRFGDAPAVVRPFAEGLAVHECFFADEVRPFEELEVGERPNATAEEKRLARALLEQLEQDAFDTVRFPDDYVARVKTAVDAKVAGKEVVEPPPAPADAAQIDLLEALRRSLGPGTKKARDRGARARVAG